ncbi:unnamed protein product [Lepeophtheirus salmonis]|uniref:(salmon louse) hypothetical protein n=1 Tax=Lepeophtheirus salmonis TaxID=72036 RepID=A0A7R8CNS4_LEPSM|nr:unnamed protein product [Lepeophtheirus salmonis]CAF2878175.1 unnamed protein product [Lepeophtheirus salmonis]
MLHISLVSGRFGVAGQSHIVSVLLLLPRSFDLSISCDQLHLLTFVFQFLQKFIFEIISKVRILLAKVFDDRHFIERRNYCGHEKIQFFEQVAILVFKPLGGTIVGKASNKHLSPHGDPGQKRWRRLQFFKIDFKDIKGAVKADPNKSIQRHGEYLGISLMMASRAVQNEDGKNLVMKKKPLCTRRMTQEHTHRSKAHLNDLKSLPDVSGILFSNKKNWTVDPVFNRPKGSLFSFRNHEEGVTSSQRPTNLPQ